MKKIIEAVNYARQNTRIHIETDFEGTLEETHVEYHQANLQVLFDAQSGRMEIMLNDRTIAKVAIKGELEVEEVCNVYRYKDDDYSEWKDCSEKEYHEVG